MGLTKVHTTIINLDDKRKQSSDEFLVDTGANYTVVPSHIVKQLNLKPIRKQSFSLADGSTVVRKLGQALVKIDNRTAPTTVVLGQKGDSAILGVVTFEEMGLVVDPFKRQLRPMKLMLG